MTKKYWTGSSIEADDERQLCSSCSRETENVLDICNNCLDENDEETNDINSKEIYD